MSKIKYLNKDFNQFKKDLIDFAKYYYPNTYNDFSPNSIGMMFIQMASYIGDVLSYYTDFSINEMFIQHTKQRENLIKLANAYGYRICPNSTAIVQLTVSITVPETTDINGQIIPNMELIPTISPGFSVKGQLDDEIQFVCLETIVFNLNSPNTKSHYNADQRTFDLITNVNAISIIKKELVQNTPAIPIKY